MVDLQKLIKEKILSIEELNPGYENHSSDVWLVKTRDKEVIVRTTKSVDEDFGPFWSGCKEVFGINPSNVYALENVNNILCNLSSIKIPKVIGKGYIDKEYIMVEKLSGDTLKKFLGRPKELLYSLGKGLAQIHKYQMNYFGNPLGTLRIENKDFHQHLISKMKILVKQFYLNNHKIVSKLPEIINILENLKPPKTSSYILVDMDPTQFLSDGNIITGLVDTEAYVIGPRELDFIALEYVLDKQSAEDFIDGYKSILNIPDLSQYRIPYRYLYRLLEIQGREDLDVWLNYSIYF